MEASEEDKHTHLAWSEQFHYFVLEEDSGSKLRLCEGHLHVLLWLACAICKWTAIKQVLCSQGCCQTVWSFWFDFSIIHYRLCFKICASWRLARTNLTIKNWPQVLKLAIWFAEIPMHSGWKVLQTKIRRKLDLCSDSLIWRQPGSEVAYAAVLYPRIETN